MTEIRFRRLHPAHSSASRHVRRGTDTPPCSAQGGFLRAKKSRRLVAEERPAGIPPYWRLVGDGRGGLLRREQAEVWMAVLAARGLPFRIAGRRRLKMFVPALVARIACAELAAMADEQERRALPPPPEPPAHENAHWVLFFLLGLILWHGVRMGWGPLSGLSAFLGVPDSAAWIQRGGLDIYRVTRLHEWWRTLTALTLHADSVHLFGNVLFGAPFVVLVCRRLGLGFGLLLIVAAGCLGNVATAFYRELGQTSLGFSTALFGAVGVLSGFMAVQGAAGAAEADTLRWRRAVLLLAAGAGILAMLGTEGEHTDYAAHVFGLLAGVLVGGTAAWGYPSRGSVSCFVQLGSGLFLVMLIALAWWRALQG